MSCWERRFSAQRGRFNRQRVDAYESGLKALYQSLCSQAALSSDALSTLLQQDVPGSKVQTRIAVDGHDIEVMQEDSGLWTVLKPTDIHFIGQRPAALEAPKSNRTLFDALIDQQQETQKVKLKRI